MDSTTSDPRIPQRDDTLEAQYSGLARLECAHCFGCGYVLITLEGDGGEIDELVPCRRCNGRD